LASLRSPDLADWLEQKLREYGVSGRQFNFALRFADVEAELKMVEGHIFRLRKLGARITLTDFGETPGAFNYLKRILVDYLRVPMGLLDKRGDELMELVRKAHERHKSIIVPGVEAPRHMDLVWSSGADYVQGYFIQRPQAHPNFDFSSFVLG
jgi:EAL domain-containing protein (putative c-di-GMP-specific phosphodiesterase class I)